MAGRVRAFDARERWRIVMAGDEDNRDLQAVVQVEAGQLVHVDIEHETRGLAMGEPGEELTGGRERLGLVAGRLHHAQERTTHGGVVVDNRNDRYIAHVTFPLSSP